MNREAVIHQQILDHLSNAVLLFDGQLKLAYINPAGEMLLAGSARQMRGARVKELFHCREHLIEFDLKRALKSGESITERSVVLDSPFHSMTVNFSVTPLLDGAEPNAVLLELQQVDHQLQVSREEQLLSQQNTVRMLVRGLAHEIKNPLGGLRGAAQLLSRELQDGELREYTKIIIDEADRLQSLVDRMLGPTRPLKKAVLNIHLVLERVRQLVQAEAPPGVVIQRDYDPSMPPVFGDSDQLIQAILNIVRNAAQAVEEKGEVTIRTRIHRQVTIGTQRNKLVVKIDIVDNGPGIEPGMVSQIFYPMITGRAGGTGLGLSIAQSLINQHGGVVQCSSSPGHTVFSVLLPVEDGNE